MIHSMNSLATGDVSCTCGHTLLTDTALRGRVTVGESDLATVLCEKGFAWAATREESIAKHMARRVAGVVALTATAGCTVIRDGSSYVLISGTNSVTGDISQKGQATLPTHPVAVAVVLIGVLAGLAALGWLIHNREATRAGGQDHHGGMT